MLRSLKRTIVFSLAATGLCAPSMAQPMAPSFKVAIETIATTEKEDIGSVYCPMRAKQGGLVVCSGPVGARVYKNAMQVGVIDETGLAAIGLRTDEASGLRISIDTDDGVMRDFDIGVDDRVDPVRYVTGVDCDKVDARSEEQKAHAARSWETKVAAFARREQSIDPRIVFAPPTTGRFSSPFGPRRVYTGVSKVTGKECTSTSVHRGLDMAVPVGTPLLAPLGGTITLADPDLYYEGGAVFLDHGWGLVSVFIHLSDVSAVKVGQVVQTGDVIGATGNTGRSSGPHLHWAIKWRPEMEGHSEFYVDPAILLKMEVVEPNERAQDEADRN